MISANLVNRVLAAAGLFVILPVLGPYAADSGLISKASDHSVQETVERFEKAVKARGSVGWMVFTEIDHAVAASQNGLTLKPRTVIIFGNPKLGTKPMEGAPTLESAESIDQVLASFAEEATHSPAPGPPVTPVKPL